MTMQESPRPAGPQEPFFPVASARSGQNEAGFPLTPLEKSVQAAIMDRVDAGADAFVLATAELAMSLATNVAKGNVKGRAIANEATALRESLASLQADRLDAVADEANAALLPANVTDFTAALALRPVVGGPDARQM